MKVLIIEDEPKVAAFIKRGLDENGYQAETAFDGMVGAHMLKGGDYAFVILDVNLPGKNGFEVCKEIRSFNRAIPVLMLTALGTTNDKVEGFDAGADDYMVKPFEFIELLARMRAMIKRTQGGHASSRMLTLGDLEMDLEAKTVHRGGNEVSLTAKEFALLEYLMRNKGKVISKAEIASKVWDIHFDTGTNVIEVYVNFLRKKIDKDFDKKLIHTKVGMGYVLKDV